MLARTTGALAVLGLAPASAFAALYPPAAGNHPRLDNGDGLDYTGASFRGVAPGERH